MPQDKLKSLNSIKEDVYALYPNAVKVAITFEGERITVAPTEKYAVTPQTLEE
ncbi:hypothetical protein [Paenibacillus odorifer]|uniref:hypothetical protein n=1 Tax=Paenibacillus odorifer TaxID=189426 RepID=UPI0015C3A96A|nr:hypothetical protein [Paenibacillus odorifer]